ncbi:unnamed protein product [Urochloa humidicola]
MPGRQRKSLQLQPARSTTTVKDEIDDDKPCTPNVLHSNRAVKVDTGGDGEVKPNISAEHKMVYTQNRFRRCHGSKYGRDSRYEYIMSIAQRIKLSLADAVPGVGERLFHNAFKCLIDAIVASQTEDVLVAELKDPASYHSMSCSQTISVVEELIELSATLADINPYIDLNHKSGSAPDVAIHVRSNFKSLPEPNWSTEKVNGFYYNKLILVLHDLKCSGLAGLSPDSSEKEALDVLLDYYMAYSSTHVKKVDKMAGSSDICRPISTTTRKRERETYEVLLFAAGVGETNGLFDGRLFEYVQELRLSCLSFMLKLMDKVGTVVYPVNLHRRFGKDATDIINQWMNKQKVHPEKSPNYIEGIDQCIVLARYAAALIKGISSRVQDAFANLTDMLRRQQHWYEFGPEALRVLSLLDCGAFRKAEDQMEIPLHAVSICDVTKTKDNRVISLESDADNLKVLATILHVLKDIGPLDAFVAPSPREIALLEKILEHVSLCVDGFLSTKAYLKERELTVAPASTLVAESTMHRINKNGMFRGFSLVYFVHGGKYLVESLFEDFEQVQEDVDLMIPSLQKHKVLMQNV